MPEYSLLTTVSYALIPFAAMVVGSLIAAVRPPNALVRNYVQHLAAGVVISVVAVELLPEVVAQHQPALVAVGFTLGVIVMFGIKHLTQGATAGSEESPAALLWAIGVDVLLDGLLVGISFAEGAQAGRLLTFALAVEMLSLSLALSATLFKLGRSRASVIGTTVGLGSLILVGSAVGYLVVAALPPAALELVLSFGLAALLYLVTEELLVEAHEERETPLSTAMLFVGFLVFLILGMM
jgi:ZIP family zinc transporter